ncbi:hypothetical protein NEOKW01_1240 [Nematocida sp. AWRm80]|nr:hypothetical protein NEOKW01_1240 [Nematocida sp. AWRm80]
MSSAPSACDGCPAKNTCSIKNELPEVQSRISKAFENKIVLGVMSGKGGVGKSTIAASLALALSQLTKVCLIDMDIAGPSIPRITNTTPLKAIGESLIPIEYNNHLDVLSPPDPEDNHTKGIEVLGYLSMINTEKYQILVLDTPPGTSDIHITLSKFIPHLKVLLVTTPHILSVSDTERQLSFCKRTQIEPLGIISNMSTLCCSNCHYNIDLYPETHSINDTSLKLPKLSLPLNQSIAKAADTGNIPSIFPSDYVTTLYNLIIKK